MPTEQIGDDSFFTKKFFVKAAKVTAAVGVACVVGPSLFVVFYGGAVQAGSAFAFCQSAAMGGSAALAAVAGASAGGTAAIATMKELAETPPSKSWADGSEFRPSTGLINAILEVA
ncbi:hypothetical protein DFH11DRAFT_1727552 [Phellopilus nigrolimitatus]|nr:hypothetical protein DFH11DRAFT_1727552 [Phellopilus nigrolimitatus]